MPKVARCSVRSPVGDQRQAPQEPSPQQHAQQAGDHEAEQPRRGQATSRVKAHADHEVMQARQQSHRDLGIALGKPWIWSGSDQRSRSPRSSSTRALAAARSMTLPDVFSTLVKEHAWNGHQSAAAHFYNRLQRSPGARKSWRRTSFDRLANSGSAPAPPAPRPAPDPRRPG